jgi:hypothetical protein
LAKNLTPSPPHEGDDPSSYVSNLANTVDTALRRYDVDLRQCMSNTACKQLKKKSKMVIAETGDKEQKSEDAQSISGMLGYGIAKQALK